MNMFIMARSILHMGPDDLSNGKGHFHFLKWPLPHSVRPPLN